MAIVKNGEVYTNGFGLADRELNIPVTSSTKMNIGSVTKSLTAILWARLISEAQDINDTRYNYIKRFYFCQILVPNPHK